MAELPKDEPAVSSAFIFTDYSQEEVKKDFPEDSWIV